MNPKDNDSGQMVEELSQRIGLSYSTVHELLKTGWEYQEAMGKAPQWVDNRLGGVVR